MDVTCTGKPSGLSEAGHVAWHFHPQCFHKLAFTHTNRKISRDIQGQIVQLCVMLPCARPPSLPPSLDLIFLTTLDVGERKLDRGAVEV